MANYKLEFDGLQEFLDALDKVDGKSEERVRKHLNRQGREFINAAKDKTPDGDVGTKEDKKIINNYVSMRVERRFDEYDKPVRNKAPHHHLVNNGHRMVNRNGEVTGFVPGRFYMEETVKEKEDDFTNETEDWLDELYKELVE